MRSMTIRGVAMSGVRVRRKYDNKGRGNEGV